MHGNYISLVLHKIQCCSLLIYQLLLSSCHIGIFLLEIYGCTLAMYHCSYLISRQTQAHLHSPLSCTLLQTTNQRNTIIYAFSWRIRQGISIVTKVGEAWASPESSGAHRLDTQPTTASWLPRSPLLLWPLEGCSTNDFSGYANTHEIPRRLDRAWKFSYLSTAAYIGLFQNTFQTPILQGSRKPRF